MICDDLMIDEIKEILRSYEKFKAKVNEFNDKLKSQ